MVTILPRKMVIWGMVYGIVLTIPVSRDRSDRSVRLNRRQKTARNWPFSGGKLNDLNVDHMRRNSQNLIYELPSDNLLHSYRKSPFSSPVNHLFQWAMASIAFFMFTRGYIKIESNQPPRRPLHHSTLLQEDNFQSLLPKTYPTKIGLDWPFPFFFGCLRLRS